MGRVESRDGWRPSNGPAEWPPNVIGRSILSSSPGVILKCIVQSPIPRDFFSFCRFGDDFKNRHFSQVPWMIPLQRVKH